MRRRTVAGKKRRWMKANPAERQRFILAELVAGTSREVAAGRAGISVRDLDLIAAEPSFREELKAARRRRSDEGGPGS